MSVYTPAELEKLYVWQVASFRKMIAERIQTSEQPNMKFFFEADPVTDAQRKLPERIEFRLDGPTEMGRNGDQRGYKIEINALVFTSYNERNLFKHQMNVATAVRVLSDDFKVYQMGYSDSTDDYVGCYQLVDTRGDLVVVAEHGQIDPNAKVQQATIEAHFEMWLDT